MVPVFVEPVTSEAAVRMTASSAAPLPGWMYEQRDARFRAADLVTEDVIFLRKTPELSTGGDRFLIWLVILVHVLVFAAWFREPALVGVVVAILVLVFVIRIVRNLRLDPLHPD